KMLLAFHVLTAFLLVGCIEFDEVTQLRPDGGVDFTLTVLVPEMPDKKTDEKTQDMNRELEEVFAALDGAKLLGRGEETKYGKQRVWFSASLPSLKSLGDIYSGLGKGSGKESQESAKKSREALDHIFSQRNEYRVEKTKQGNLRISREFKPGKVKAKKPEKKESKEAEELSKNMEEMMMNSMTFRFEFFSPTPVLSTNATGRFGQALRWEASLGYLSKNPFKMELEIASTPELEAVLLGKK
ncbi:MAG TPA: hypothetical protein VFW62_08460, partial [bacterium]|nr:hypothetical protein [bacterium]